MLSRPCPTTTALCEGSAFAPKTGGAINNHNYHANAAANRKAAEVTGMARGGGGGGLRSVFTGWSTPPANRNMQSGRRDSDGGRKSSSILRMFNSARGGGGGGVKSAADKPGTTGGVEVLGNFPSIPDASVYSRTGWHAQFGSASRSEKKRPW